MTTKPDDERADAPSDGATGVFPMRGRISSISGRLAAGGQPGMTALDHVELELPDGRAVEFAQPLSGVQATVKGVVEIRPMSFINPATGRAICPICLAEGAAMHDEHVPQTALGGVEMTSTCKPCNSDLGSRVEVDLQAWFDQQLIETNIEHDGDIPGRRRFPKVYYRQSTDDSTFMMWAEGPSTPEIDAMIQSGTWQVNFRLPDFRRAMTALLKHAYLAACLHLQGVPNTEEAAAIRADLLAARETRRREELPPIEERVVVYRGGVGRPGPPLALVAMDPPDGGEQRPLISLAGVLFVSWPFEAPEHSSMPDTITS